MSEFSVRLLFNEMQWPAKRGILCLLLHQSRGLRSAVCSRSALCKVIYLCRVCCTSVTSGAWLSKLELNEKIFLYGDQQDKFTKQNESEFLLGSVAWYFLLCVYILLYICVYIYVRLYKSCSNFSRLGKRDFPKFIHLLFFFPSPTKLL